jgi:hypothetical protein
MSAIIIDITVGLSLRVSINRDVAISLSLGGRGLPTISPLPRWERIKVRVK